MRRLTRGAAALVLGSGLATAAAAQVPAPGTPPAPATPPGAVPMTPPGTPATPPGGLPAPAGLTPPGTPAGLPQPKVEPRPTGVAATVNNHPIPEVAVYRALRQFPDNVRDMARKEIL